MDSNLKAIVGILKSGEIGILPTDTLYGLVGQALNKKAVERIYVVRKRKPDKPLIVLIGSLKDLGLFGIKPDQETLQILKKNWPGKVSIILPLPVNPKKGGNLDSRLRGNDTEDNLFYLHRGTNTLAFRLPKNERLQGLLNKTGPLVAPSANPEDLPPAETIEQAQKYFGDSVDFYIDGGTIKGQPSTLAKLKDGKIQILRQGSAKIKLD